MSDKSVPPPSAEDPSASPDTGFYSFRKLVPSALQTGAGECFRGEKDSGIVPMLRRSSPAGIFSLRRVQNLAARILPHQSGKILCPPGPIPMGPLPPLIVSSLMRSGTHLAMDLILNNIAGYRQSPLYLDFDSYVFEGFSAKALLETGSCVIKTHFIQRPFDPQAGEMLRRLADRGVVIIPVRRMESIQRSMTGFGINASREELQNIHARHLEFWKAHDPILVNFESLLNPREAAAFLSQLRDRAGLPRIPQDKFPFVAGDSRPRNLWRKMRTRLQSFRAPRINTTVGFKL